MSRVEPASASPSAPSLGRRFSVLACVGTTFATWARNAAAFAVVSAACQAPVVLLSRFADWTFARSESRGVALGLVSILLSLLSWNLSLGAVTFGVLEDRRGARATIGRCLAVATRTLPRLFGISFRMALHLAVAGVPFAGLTFVVAAVLPFPDGGGEFALFSLAPMVFVAVTLAVALLAYLVCFATSGSVAVVEGLDPVHAMERSRRLSSGRRFAVGATLLLVAVAPVALSVGLGPFARGYFEGSPWSPAVWRWAGTAFDMLVTAPLLGTAVATVYRDLRREREGVDVDELADVFD